MKCLRSLPWCVLALCVIPAQAAEFAAAISPPRFELEADPGEVLREVITIKNVGNTPAEMQVRTADWALGEDGGVIIYPEVLQPGSCRPWTRIERHRVSVAAGYERRYRFEVHVPKGAGRGECRFAILFQQPPEAADTMSVGQVNLPVLGRIAVIVYVGIAGATPELHIKDVRALPGDRSRLPVLIVENAGDAHGRAQGVLTLEGARGRTVQATVSTAPILPGETRGLQLWPAGAGEESAPAIEYPVTVTGTVEWSEGSRVLDVRVSGQQQAPPRGRETATR